jgi:xylulokinase
MCRELPVKIMTPSTCLLGIDIGTEGCKAIVFNLSGESVARSYQQYSVTIPQPTWAEQNPQHWWKAVRKSVADVVKQTSKKQGEISCVSVSGQSPVLLPVDKHGNALMNALIWMDRRAIEQSEMMAQTIGVADDPSMNLPKAAWVKENRPQVFQKAYKFVQTSDFIEFKLTGNFVTDWLNAGTFHFDYHRHEWPTDLLNRLKIPVEKLPNVLRSSEIVGTVTDAAARETGLKKGTPVAAGGIDAYLAMIGANALTIGSTCEITGSSTCLMVPSRHEIHDPEKRVHCEKFPMLPNFWITWGTMSTTGASLRWFRDNIEPKASYQDLDSEAEEAPPGSDGLIFLPYMMGERSPIWDAYARGVFLGLSLKHSRNHLTRALLEGCAFGIRHNLETIEKLGAHVNEIRSCGGAAKSKFFGQIKADVTGKTVVIPREIEASALGAAILASIGVGLQPNLRKAAQEMVHTECRINPQKDLFEKYDLSFRMYKDAYLHLKKYFKRYYSSGTHLRTRGSNEK